MLLSRENTDLTTTTTPASVGGVSLLDLDQSISVHHYWLIN